MLKLHTPIELKNNPSLLTLGGGFGERIRTNYRQIGSGLTSEDLLHLMSAPPEIYLAETGGHSLVETENSFSSQEIKLNLINNVLNRVLLSEHVGMTYQDQVFVEQTLRKLGVTDVKEFLRQVRLLQEETNNRNELIDLYWENREELTAILSGHEKVKKAGETSGDEEKGEPQDVRLWLHQEIFDRLHVGALYQTMRNYMSQRTGDAYFLSRQQLQVGEQSVMAEHLLLNQLKSSTLKEALPLVYNRLNVYELGGDDGERGTVTERSSLLRETVSAVLLGAADQVYALCFQNLHQDKNAWYELANAVYETASNTFARLESYHSHVQPGRAGIAEYQRDILRSRSREITALRQLLERKETAGRLYGPPQAPEGEALFYREPEEAGEAGVAGVYEDRRTTNENYIRQQQERREVEKLLTAEELLHREAGLLERQREQHTEHVRESEEKRMLKELHMEREKTREELLHRETGGEAGQEGTTQVYENGRTINENNIIRQPERRELTERIFGERLLHRETETRAEHDALHTGEVRETLHTHTEQTLRIDREKAREDVMRAMQEPGEVLTEYLAMPTALEAELAEARETLREIYDEETLRIFETLAAYRRQPEVLLEQGVVVRDGFGQLMRDARMEHLTEEVLREELSEEHREETVRELSQIRFQTKREALRDKTREERTRELHTLELLHKEQETAIDEELLEELRNVSRHTLQEREQHQEIVNERNISEQTVTNRVNELRLGENEQMEEMLGRKVRQQLRGMSEEVYRKLEKRMDAERRRRGI